MATSGSKTFFFPVDNIIRTAMQRVGGEWTNAQEQSLARDELNLLMFELINKDAPLGSIKELSVSVGTSDGSFLIENGTIGILDAIVRTPTVVSTGTSSTEYSATEYRDMQMGRMSFQEFHAINDKQKSSRPTSFTTEVSGQELTLKIWPINDTVPRSIRYFAIVQPDVVTRSTQELDIMNRYVPAVIEGLAYRLGKGRKGVSTERLNTLKMDYKELLQEAFDADRERTAVYFRPAIRKGY
jgi:hypothetical protein